jgi:hypothetical protein
MEKEKVEIGDPITVGEITIIPVIELSIKCRFSKKYFSYFGKKQPTSIVVVSPSGKWALRVSGEEVPLDQFIQDTPGMKEVLETI